MKTPTRLLFLAAAAALLAVPGVRAEDTTAAAPSASARQKEQRDNRLQQLDEKLHLTAEQKTRIQQIWVDAASQGKALRDNQAASNRERRVKRREMMRATQQQVRAVLTPEQQRIFDGMPRRHQRSDPPADDAEGR